MRTITLVSLAIFLSSLSSNAQTFVSSPADPVPHDLQIFSEDGHPFILRVNGENINKTPSTSVSLTTYNAALQVHVDFVNPALPDVNKRYLRVAVECQEIPFAQSTVYRLKEKKGTYKFRMVSNSNKVTASQQVIYMH